MTFTVTSRGEDGFTFELTAIIPAFTPSANALLYLWDINEVDADIASISGHEDGTGWAKITSVSYNAQRFSLWACKTGASPASSTVTVTHSSGSARGVAWITEVTGQDTGVTAAAATIQSTTGTNYNTATMAVSPALSAFASATNLTLFGMGCVGTDLTPTFAPDTGFTESFETTVITRGATDYQAAEDTTPTATITGYAFRYFASIAVEVKELPAQSITALTDPVTDGSTGNTFSVSGFGGDITGITLKDDVVTTHVVTGSIQSGTGTGPYSWSLPDVSGYTSDTLGTPFDSAYWGHTANVTDGTDVASLAIVYNPKTGWARVDVGTPTTTQGSVFYGWTGTPAQYDQVYYPTANNTSVASTGILTTDQLAGSIKMLYFDQSDHKWKPFYVVISRTNTGSLTFTTFGSLGL